MKKIKHPIQILLILTSLISCNNNQKGNMNFKERTSYDSFINGEKGVQVDDKHLERVSDSIANESINPYFDKEQWKKDAETYLKLKRGETVKVTPKEKSKNRPKYYRSIDIPESNNDFEYSEYWRKEAYKLSKEFIIDKNSKSKTKNCTVISQGIFQPELVKYLGDQRYLVKVLCEYECDNGNIGQNIVKVEAHYMSHNLWDIHAY